MPDHIMSVDLANPIPLNEDAAEHHGWLSKLQGNILRSHGRDYSAHVFCRLPDDIGAARAVLRRLIPYVTSARQQYVDTCHRRKTGEGSTLFGTLSLSASGYRAIGFAGLSAFEEPKENARDPDACFLGGMKAHPDDLADPPVDEWEPPFRGRIDAMLLLAHASRDAVLQAVATAQALIAPGHVTSIEFGDQIRNGAGQAIEHFGFVDGRSQPLYLKDDFETDVWGRPRREAKGDRPLERWIPFEPLGRVLRPDPFGVDASCLGSFLVFRKLEQDVRGFAAAETRLAHALKLEGTAAERAGAMVVGRFRDGSPLTSSASPGWHPHADNDFTYAEDPCCRRCPAHAHVRRVNPRGSVDGDAERVRRLTRRGVTYGDTSAVAGPDVSPESLPDTGVGMLFMAYQASIRRQFAFVQKQWIASPDFPRSRTGPDPLVGGTTAAAGATHKWPTNFNGAEHVPLSFGSYVRMLGGEFFFTPSVPFLQTL